MKKNEYWLELACLADDHEEGKINNWELKECINKLAELMGVSYEEAFTDYTSL